MIENGAAWKVLEHMYGEELNPETANVVGPGTWDANDEDCLSEKAEKEFLVLYGDDYTFLRLVSAQLERAASRLSSPSPFSSIAKELL